MSETPFRLAISVMGLLALCISVYHRIQAARSGERISRREEGFLFATVLRLAGLLLGISTLGYLIAPEMFRWAAIPLPDWLRWLGAVSGGAGVLLVYWTLACLGKNLTDTVAVRAAASLITHGPYRWVRHPFYVSAAILMASATLLSASGLIGACSLLVLLLLAIRTPKEEQMLRERFGRAYDEYTAATGRFFPRLGGGKR